jgi:hypothetical protein
VTGEAALLGPDDREWVEALSQLRHDVYHLPEYARIDARLTGSSPLAFWYTDRGHVWLLPLVLRPIPDSPLCDVASPYGYPGPVSDTTDPEFWSRAARAMTELLRKEGIVTAFVRLHPLLPAPIAALDSAGTVVHHGQTVSMDLTLATDDMWRQTRRTHRKHINQSHRAGVTVVMDDWGRFDEWLLTYHENMRRVGASAYYFFSGQHLAGLHDALGGRMHLALAEVGGETIGGTVFFEHDGIMQAHLQSVRDDHRLHADKLLYDTVRRWGAERGNDVYHIGGGLGGADDSLFFYKAGFSESRHEFHTWRVVADPDAYAGLVGHGVPGAGSTTGHFPPYR